MASINPVHHVPPFAVTVIYIPLWHLLILLRIADGLPLSHHLHSTMASINLSSSCSRCALHINLHSTMASINLNSAEVQSDENFIYIPLWHLLIWAPVSPVSPLGPIYIPLLIGDPLWFWHKDAEFTFHYGIY